jgi:tripartite-type tricarboxylate transporter receptor subunit TctC
MVRFARSFAAALVVALSAGAAPASDYYAGKTIDVIVGSDAGGPFDLYARMIARHMVNHIPGRPLFLIKNMPGAGANKATAFVYGLAAKDGTAIGVITPGAIMGPLTDDALKERFDPQKFVYLGSADSAARVCVTFATSKVKTFEEARRTRVVVGATAGGGASKDYPTMLNAVAGAKFDIVTGYGGVGDYLLAMERGEVDGTCTGWSVFPSTKPDWIRDGKLNILLQLGVVADPQFTAMGVPEVWPYLKSDEDRRMVELMVSQQQFQRPYVLPPGTDPAAAATLRAAFDATMRDREFLDEAAKARLTVSASSGAAVQELVDRIYNTPPALIERFKRTMGLAR